MIEARFDYEATHRQPWEEVTPHEPTFKRRDGTVHWTCSCGEASPVGKYKSESTAQKRFDRHKASCLAPEYLELWQNRNSSEELSSLTAAELI